MALQSHWEIAEIIEDFIASIDTFRAEVYALEGDSFPEWWAKRNPRLAEQRTSLHEFVHAVKLFDELEIGFKRQANLLAHLSVATYPHVPEMVPIEQLLSALSSGSAVELYGWEHDVGPTWRALLALTNAGHFRADRVQTNCYYVTAAEWVADHFAGDAYRELFDSTVAQILADGPFSSERVAESGPLSMPEFFDSTHRAETDFEPCPCLNEPKPRYRDWFDEQQVADIDPAPPFFDPNSDHADRAELQRILESKGMGASEADEFFQSVAFGDVVAIEDGTWVSSLRQDRQLVDTDGFTFRIEPCTDTGFDEQVTLRFRRGQIRCMTRFRIPSGGADRMSWGAELQRALPHLMDLAEVDAVSPRDQRVGISLRLDYVSSSNVATVTRFGNGDEPTRTFGPFLTLTDAARAAVWLARRQPRLS